MKIECETPTMNGGRRGEERLKAEGARQVRPGRSQRDVIAAARRRRRLLLLPQTRRTTTTEVAGRRLRQATTMMTTTVTMRQMRHERRVQRTAPRTTTVAARTMQWQQQQQLSMAVTTAEVTAVAELGGDRGEKHEVGARLPAAEKRPCVLRTPHRMRSWPAEQLLPSFGSPDQLTTARVGPACAPSLTPAP